jgi:hypothetical protein
LSFNLPVILKKTHHTRVLIAIILVFCSYLIKRNFTYRQPLMTNNNGI